MIILVQICFRQLGPYTESLHEPPQILFGSPVQGALHSTAGAGIKFESSFPQ